MLQLLPQIIIITTNNNNPNYYYYYYYLLLKDLLQFDFPMSLFPGLYCKSSCGSSSIGKACGNSKAGGGVDEFALTTDCKGIGQSDVFE